MDNTCVCCGEIIPEGRQVCPRCEYNLANCEVKKFDADDDFIQLTIDDMEDNQ